MSNPEVRLVKNKDIDYVKWDSCVARSVVPLVYAQSDYLDLISPGWDALIIGDYDYIMPLNIRKKLGINFLLQPIFAQQHGVFPEAKESVQHIFLSYIKEHFRYVAIQLNSSHSANIPEGFQFSQRTNFIMNLTSTYAELKNNYSKHARRQIRKAEDNKVVVIKGLQTKEYLDLKNLATENKLSKPSMQTLKRLIEYGTGHGKGMIYAAYSKENTLCSAAFFLISGRRATYLNAASSNEGKANSSMYQIVDQFIREHSDTNLTLDFEGSSIPGIARFYAGFGAQTEHYYCLKLNRLPIPLRWLIKY
jgi:hypothetical protein